MSCCLGSSWHLIVNWLYLFLIGKWATKNYSFPRMTNRWTSGHQKKKPQGNISYHITPDKPVPLVFVLPVVMLITVAAFRMNMISLCECNLTHSPSVVLWQVTTPCTLACMFPRATTGGDATGASLVTRRSGTGLNRAQKDTSQMGRLQMNPLRASSNLWVSSDKLVLLVWWSPSLQDINTSVVNETNEAGRAGWDGSQDRRSTKKSKKKSQGRNLLNRNTRLKGWEPANLKITLDWLKCVK